MQLREFLPPVVVRSLSRIRPAKYGWFGDYTSWEEANFQSGGYNASEILEKVKASVLQVKEGKALYERDSVLFDSIQYSWPLLAGLLWTAASAKGVLHVLDFGGSLGSTYFQNRKFLSSLNDVTWSVVEQKEFVVEGKSHFEDSILKFYSDIDSCLREMHPNVFIFSCVLQYLKSPYEAVKAARVQGPQTIIVDNMPFTEGRQRLTIQRVPPQIYKASYPCWILNREQFIDAFRPDYVLVEHFESPLTIQLDGSTVPYEGFIFRKTENS